MHDSSLPHRERLLSTLWIATHAIHRRQDRHSIPACRGGRFLALRRLRGWSQIAVAVPLLVAGLVLVALPIDFAVMVIRAGEIQSVLKSSTEVPMNTLLLATGLTGFLGGLWLFFRRKLRQTPA